jgi:DNA-binding transcriptional ArsR family regulator
LALDPYQNHHLFNVNEAMSGLETDRMGVARLTISLHEARLFCALKKAQETWQTTKELAASTRMSDRTVRMHILRFVKSGISQEMRIFPGYRYKLSTESKGLDAEYLRRLEDAVEIFDLDEKDTLKNAT